MAELEFKAFKLPGCAQFDVKAGKNVTQTIIDFQNSLGIIDKRPSK